MAIIQDIIDGGVSVDQNGYKHTRFFLVTDLEGEAEHRLYNGINTAGIPQYGDLHPVIPNVIVTSLTASPESKQNSVVRVTVNYEAPSFEVKEPDEGSLPTIQVGSNVSTSKTQKDNSGKKISVSLTTRNNDSIVQTGEVDVESPQTALQFERRESSSPLTKSITYTGSVNKNKIGIYEAKTLLCTGIEGTSDDNGLTYSVVYRFQYKPDTWDVALAFIDPGTGKIHVDADVETNNGIKTASIYPEKDFRPLNLSL